MEPKMQCPRLEALHRSVRMAIAAGHGAFEAREKAKLAAEVEEERRMKAHGAARFSEVLSALPQRIADAFANAEVLPVQCIVTFVRCSEYEGDIFHPSSSRTAKPLADPVNLRGAAAWIFEELQMARCEPTLRFEYPFAAGNLNAQPGLLDQLCICISVQ
jgi:hypothetical protein